MTRGDYIDHLKAILCYDSLIDYLCVADRYWLHREIINNYGDITRKAIVKDASRKVLAMSYKIKDTKWERPQLRYNAFRELEVYEGYWKPFKAKDYV